jgi:hypothetical protein
MNFRNLLFISLIVMAALNVSAQLQVNKLTTDYKTNPIGIDNPKPQLSWNLESSQPNTLQESYEIRAALSQADLAKKNKQLWNSGIVESDQSIHIIYEGESLKSHQRVYWQVRVVDNHDKKSKWSEPAFFEMGKLTSEDWVADWISPTWEEDPKKSEPSPYLRREFVLGNNIKQARLYVSCQGLYKVEINGHRVGDQEFTPGWTGDAQVFAPTACFNMNAATFYRKWLKDLAADQRDDGAIPHVVPDILGGMGAAGWADAGVVIPWVVYLDYGDLTVLENQYESMKTWIGFMQERAGEDLIWTGDFHFGDWLAFASTRSDYMGAYTVKDLIATAYYSYSSSIVGKAAKVLGREKEALYYTQLSEEIKKAFNDEFVTPNGRLVAHTQTAYTLALAFDMLDEETARKSAAFLAGDVEEFGHITTGFLGTPLISQTLTDIGRNDLAYLLLRRTRYPSWLYPVTMGATTIWERWDGQKPDSTFQDKGMNSFNHYAYGAIGKWMYQVVAGIGLDEKNPAYKHIIIQPRPGGGLTSAKATHQSMYGEIVSGWKLDEEQLTMEVEIPANTTATLHIPGESSGITINGSGLEESGIEYKGQEGKVLGKTGSGTYTFKTTFSNPIE